MTEARTESRPVTPVGMALGQAIGQAQSVLTRQLAGVLARTGTRRETYLALQRLQVNGDAMEREAYVRDLSDWLDVDLWSARALAGSLVSEGLATEDAATIRVAEAGADLRGRARQEIGDIMEPVYAELHPADIETTVQTLRRMTLLTRARQADVAPADPKGDE